MASLPTFMKNTKKNRFISASFYSSHFWFDLLRVSLTHCYFAFPRQRRLIIHQESFLSSTLRAKFNFEFRCFVVLCSFYCLDMEMFNCAWTENIFSRKVRKEVKILCMRKFCISKQRSFTTKTVVNWIEMTTLWQPLNAYKIENILHKHVHDCVGINLNSNYTIIMSNLPCTMKKRL